MRSLKKRAIIVLGMHRSGTSAMTRVLNLLGLRINREIVPPQDNNPTGFWEASELLRINGQLLAHLKSDWKSIIFQKNNWADSPELTELRRRATDLIKNDFHETSFCVLKDPRLCRLLPFWCPILSESGFGIAFVCITRNPLDVIKSLETRNNLTKRSAAMLWLTHVLDAEMDSRGYPRVFVSYEQLMINWKNVALKIKEQLHLEFPISIEVATNDVETFLQKDLHHYKSSVAMLQEDELCQSEINQIYQALLKGKPEDIPIKNIFDSQCVKDYVIEMAEQQRMLTADVERLNSDIDRLNSELEALYSSSSWRVTKPLRAVKKSLSK